MSSIPEHVTAQVKRLNDDLVREHTALWDDRDFEWWRRFRDRWKAKYRPALEGLVQWGPDAVASSLNEAIAHVSSALELYIEPKLTNMIVPTDGPRVRDALSDLTILTAKLSSDDNWPPRPVAIQPIDTKRGQHLDRLSLFWAWQSDFTTSRNQIAEVLTKIVAEANASWNPKAQIVLEQAVDLGDGAVRIDDNLLRKIRAAHFFVADVTPVAVYDDNLVPNANVLIEIGYALASKDPREIFLVENTTNTDELRRTHPGARLPFDIEHVHRFKYQQPAKLRSHISADLRKRLKELDLATAPA